MKTMPSPESPEPDRIDPRIRADASADEASIIDASVYNSALHQDGPYLNGSSEPSAELDNASEMVDLILTLERPSTKSLNGMNRGEKAKLLNENSEHLRAELLKWLEEEGLANQVEKVGEATTFNTLFLKTTPYVAKMICAAPGVKEIADTNGIYFEITQSEKSPKQKLAGEKNVSKQTHIVGISEIVLWTADTEKSVHFYHELLNLEIISPPKMPNIFLKVGEGHAGIPQMLVLVPKRAEMQGQPSGHQLHHLAFELPAEAFDNQFNALVDAGFAPRNGIHPVLSSRTMYVDDPDGNEVEFICYANHD